MKTCLKLLLLFGCLSAKDPVDYVNPQIGGISHLLIPTYNTVSLPNSMLRFNPIKTPGISDHYVAGKIAGFPLNCPGHRQRPLLSLMPAVGELRVAPTQLLEEYDHDFETVQPYYYQVLLENSSIQAEFTPTHRSGIYRFTFAAATPAWIVLRGEEKVEMAVIDATTIQASESFSPVKQFAYIKFNRPIQSYGAFHDESVTKNEKKVKGDRSGLYLGFTGVENLQLEIRYGISYISYEQARLNLEQEAANRSFAEIKQSARESWNNALSQMIIDGGSDDQKTVFYTALYRTLERMVNITEDGKYFSAYDQQTHQDDRPFYVDDWSWDSFRAHHPLRILLNPAMQQDIIQSYVRMYEQSGWMPSFPQVNGDMGGMIGHHQAAIIADAYNKGLRNFDVDQAYEGLLKNAMEGTMLPWREGPATILDQFYRQHGYFPALNPGAPDPIKEVHEFEKRQSVAVTLEHAYDDWCLAQLAHGLNHQADYEKLLQRSRNYKNVYNPATGFMAPRLEDGAWVTPFDAKNSSGPGCREYYAELNAWTYSFFVPHDVAGLLQLMGGEERFIQRLDGLFDEPLYGYCRWKQTADIPDGTGMVGQFVMGNEQSFHIPYLYVYAGAPWKTQKRLRMLMETWFRNDVMGICGDEDGGAMSAWYVFSAMDFYPVAPASPIYVIGTPLFSECRIELANDRQLIIKAENNSAQNKYIQSASLNGKPLDKAWFHHDEIVDGGELVFIMGPRPNRQWAAGSPPPSQTVEP